MLAWSERHLVPNCRIVKRLLQLIPWNHDDQIQVVLSVDKGLLKDRDALRAALLESVDLLMDEITRNDAGKGG